MKNIRFNYSKLRGRIIEKFGTQQAFAAELGISDCTISTKLNCHSYFTQPEIAKAINILDIDPSEVTSYFFKL